MVVDWFRWPVSTHEELDFTLDCLERIGYLKVQNMIPFVLFLEEGSKIEGLSSQILRGQFPH
jgi:hypothetical protein